MKKTPWWGFGLLLVILAVSVAGCPASSSTPASAAPPSQGVAPTPTPPPLSRTNPNIIEEDDLHIVERFP